MRKSSLVISLAVGTAFGLLVACSPIKRGEYADGSATVFCDEGFRNVLDEEIEVFEYTYPNASIIPFYVSESEAIDSLMSGATHGIITTRELDKEQIDYVKAKQKRIVRQRCIAVDAVALIVNKDNPVSTLSLEDVKGIMQGSINKWSQLAGADTTAVKLVFDNAGSSTVSYMRDRFLPAGAKIADNKNAFAQKSNAQVFDIVKKDKNAIGIISVNWLGDDLSVAKKVPVENRMENYKVENDTVANNLTTEVKIVKVSNPTADNDFSSEGYKPYQAYINTGQYPLVRKVYFITAGTDPKVLHSFYVFVSGFVGQKIISKTGILPYHMNPRVVQLK